MISIIKNLFGSLVDKIDVHNVKQGNTKKVYKVKTRDQRGGITAGEVNIGKQDRQLDNKIKQGFLNFLINKNERIRITAGVGDAEAINLGHQIKAYLEAEGYTSVDNGVNQAIFKHQIKGMVIQRNKEWVDISIGYNDRK